jgi:hypothetical protein
MRVIPAAHQAPGAIIPREEKGSAKGERQGACAARGVGDCRRARNAPRIRIAPRRRGIHAGTFGLAELPVRLCRARLWSCSPWGWARRRQRSWGRRGMRPVRQSDSALNPRRPKSVRSRATDAHSGGLHPLPHAQKRKPSPAPNPAATAYKGLFFNNDFRYLDRPEHSPRYFGRLISNACR